MAKFPQVLYVKEERENDGNTYYIPSRSAIEIAELGVKTKIGVYRLQEMQEIEGMVTMRKLAK